MTTAILLAWAFAAGIFLGQRRERRKQQRQLNLDLAFTRATQRPQ